MIVLVSFSKVANKDAWSAWSEAIAEASLELVVGVAGSGDFRRGVDGETRCERPKAYPAIENANVISVISNQSGTTTTIWVHPCVDKVWKTHW